MSSDDTNAVQPGADRSNVPSVPADRGPGQVESGGLVDKRSVVVAALPLKKKARAALEALLGERFLLRDIRDTVYNADIVLAPAVSPQTITALKEAFPSARVIVVELEDWNFGITLGGPVTRARRAGADDYVTASSLERLSGYLHRAAADEQTDPAAAEGPASELGESTMNDLVIKELGAAVARRASPVERPRFSH